MAGKIKRNAFTIANKYQDKIILLTFLPSTLIFLTFISIVFIGNPVICKAILHTSFPRLELLVNQFSGLIVVLICSIFLVSVLITFIITNNMLGAIGRIIRELDEIIAGRSQRNITSRPNDDLTKDLLKRVNLLVECYVEHNHGKKDS